MALINVIKGPSRWDLVLCAFDVHPARSHGIRDISFTMANGDRFTMELLGIAWEPYPSLDPLRLTGQPHGSLPRGYLSPEDDGTVRVDWEPSKNRCGMVNLALVSTCHYEPLVKGTYENDYTTLPSYQVERCSTCNGLVTRLNPDTGAWEWLDGKPVDTTDRVRSVIGTTDGIELERLTQTANS